MIFTSFFKALGQLPDATFRGVVFKGLGLTLALLFGIYLIFMTVVGWFVPDVITIRWIGEIRWIDNLISWASIPLMLLLSTILMVPVASAFTGLFLDDVADAVEERHYPSLSPAPRLSFSEGLKDSLVFLGVIIGANLVALIGYIFLSPFAPLIFVALNGFLLGREYFLLVANRRLGRAGARQALSRHMPTVWIAGALMALPLTIPLVNLLIPVLGAATFTHIYHRLISTQSPAVV